jgi:hypothetical protein
VQELQKGGEEMSKKEWKWWEFEQCPSCGCDLDVLTDLPEGQAWDADEVRCNGEGCDARLQISVDEDHAYISGEW